MCLFRQEVGRSQMWRAENYGWIIVHLTYFSIRHHIHAYAQTHTDFYFFVCFSSICLLVFHHTMKRSTSCQHTVFLPLINTKETILIPLWVLSPEQKLKNSYQNFIIIINIDFKFFNRYSNCADSQVQCDISAQAYSV
jgi:hypothetical protein